jgi:hypothetical protein
VLLLALVAMGTAEASGAAEPVVLEPEEASKFVTVDEIALEEGRVTGVIVNRRPHPLRDVRLVVENVYRWPSEFRPGEESPNQAEIILVEEEIPAGSRTPFSATLRRPSSPEVGGHFVTQVHILGFSEVLVPGTPSVASPGHEG